MFPFQRLPFVLLISVLVGLTNFSCLEAQCGLSDFTCNPDSGILFYNLSLPIPAETPETPEACTPETSATEIASISGLSLNYTAIAITFIKEFDDGIYATGRASYTDPAPPMDTYNVGIILKSTDNGVTWTLEYTFEPFQTTDELRNVVTGVYRNAAGNLYAMASGLNSNGTASWYTLEKPAGGSWQVTENYSRDTANETVPYQSIASNNRLLSAGKLELSASNTLAAIRTVSDGLIEEPIAYTDPGIQTLYSAINAGDNVVVAGGVRTDGASLKEVFIDRVTSTGRVRLDQTSIPGTFAELDLHTTHAVAVTPEYAFYTYSPGSSIPDLTTKLRKIDRVTSIATEITLYPSPSINNGILSLGENLLFSIQAVDSGTVLSSPTILYSTDQGATTQSILAPDFTNRRMRAYGSAIFKFNNIFQIRDNSLLITYPVDDAVDPISPTKIYRIGCN